MEAKRTVGDYSVINSMYIGHRDIVLCENTAAKQGEKYLCCYVENVAVFERYLETLVSDDFAEIVKVFGERISEAAEEIRKETEQANKEITAKKCKAISYDESINGKVVVINGAHLRPEFRHASRQLMLCTGGFGSDPHSRGRTCFCTCLYDGRQTSYYRSDILGIIEPEDLPEWAQKGLQEAREKYEQEKAPSKEREEVR